jgi:hypothetical protein
MIARQVTEKDADEGTNVERADCGGGGGIRSAFGRSKIRS